MPDDDRVYRGSFTRLDIAANEIIEFEWNAGTILVFKRHRNREMVFSRRLIASAGIPSKAWSGERFYRLFALYPGWNDRQPGKSPEQEAPLFEMFKAIGDGLAKAGMKVNWGKLIPCALQFAACLQNAIEKDDEEEKDV